MLGGGNGWLVMSVDVCGCLWMLESISNSVGKQPAWAPKLPAWACGKHGSRCVLTSVADFERILSRTHGFALSLVLADDEQHQRGQRDDILAETLFDV